MIPYKDDNPTRTTPYITIGLIVINCLVFFYQMSLGITGTEKFIFEFGLIPLELTRFQNFSHSQAIPPFFSLLTAMFLHGGLMHLGGNMLYLWIFGDNIEDRLGHLRFLAFYLLTGVLATLSHVFITPSSNIPMIGASGAISAVLGAYLVLFPKARVHTLIFFFYFIRVIRLPAMVVLGFWFVLQFLQGVSSLSRVGGGVAWFAHIGGFVAGFILIRVFLWRRFSRKISRLH